MCLEDIFWIYKFGLLFIYIHPPNKFQIYIKGVDCHAWNIRKFRNDQTLVIRWFDEYALWFAYKTKSKLVQSKLAVSFRIYNLELGYTNGQKNIQLEDKKVKSEC